MIRILSFKSATMERKILKIDGIIIRDDDQEFTETDKKLIMDDILLITQSNGKTAILASKIMSQKEYLQDEIDQMEKKCICDVSMAVKDSNKCNRCKKPLN